MRVAVWLMTLAYVLPLLCLRSQSARAQGTQVLKVIVADFINKGKYGGDQLAIEATAAVYNELQNSGQGRFFVYGYNSEVLPAAKRLGLRVPSNPAQPAYFSRVDLLRLAKELQVDAIVEGEVGTPAPTKGRAGNVQLGVRILDVASEEYINGAFNSAKAVARPGLSSDAEELINQEVSDAALNVVRTVVQRQQVSATVLQRVGDTIVLNRGLRDGIREGDNLVVIRETTVGGRVKEGTLRVARAFATDAEAEVRTETGAIRPEDIARVLYTDDWVISGTGEVHPPTVHGRAVNFSLIGSTLAVLGLGVLIAEGARSGQSSVTGVVAEPTVASTSTGPAPEVRIKWRDNIYGQANVQQYHIYRQPDFPYSPNVSSGNNSTSGSTTTNTISAFPIGVTSGLEHVFYDMQSPHPYPINTTIIIGVAASSIGTNSNNNNNNSNSGSTSSNSGGCGSFPINGTTTTTTTVVIPTDVGFTPGISYTYQLTAIILRQQSPSSSSSGTNGGNSGSGSTGGFGNSGGSTGSGSTGTGTGGSGTGTGSNNGNSNSNGLQCIETDPVPSGLATPLLPVVISAPLATDRVNLRQFSVSFTTVQGADLYQLEVSTDPTFTNQSRIFRQTFIGSAPNSISTQTFPGTGSTLDLTTQSNLLADTAFSSFINGTSTTAPTLYVRIGARHNEDNPGPVNVLDPNNSDSNGDFRFVYNTNTTTALTNTYNGAAGTGSTGGVPPPPGSRAVRLLNATSPTRVGGRSTLPLPLPGKSVRGRSALKGGSAINAILGGGQRR